MRSTVGDPRFVPLLVLHETEAWVFAAASQLADWRGWPDLADLLQRDVEKAGGPELVNDGADTAPSKRLARHCKDYVKRWMARSSLPISASPTFAGCVRTSTNGSQGWRLGEDVHRAAARGKRETGRYFPELAGARIAAP